MEASIEGICNDQQTIQNGFHEFGSEVIKGFSADTRLIDGVLQNQNNGIAQLEAKMAKQHSEMTNKFNSIIGALGNCTPAPAPTPAPSTQPTAPLTATNPGNQEIMSSTGVIETTLNNPV